MLLFSFLLYFPGGAIPSNWFSALFVSIHNTTFVQIIGSDLQCNPVSRQDLDIVHPHFSCDMRNEFMTVFQLHLEGCIWKSFNYFSVYFDWTLFGQNDCDLILNKFKCRQYFCFAFSDQYCMLIVSGRFAISGIYCPAV